MKRNGKEDREREGEMGNLEIKKKMPQVGSRPI